MSKFKNIIVYGIIILLFVFAFAGYLINNIFNKNKPAAIATVAGSKTHIEQVMEKSIATPAPNPTVGIGRGEDYAKVTSTAIENAGGLKDIIKKGDVVVVKPNICFKGDAGGPLITDYRAVQEVIDEVKALGASRIIVAEGSIVGDAFSPSMVDTNKYDKITGAELINFNSFKEADCYLLKSKTSVTGQGIYIPKIYMDADKVIGVAKLKTHFQSDAVVSLSLKNSFGVPPGEIYGLGGKDGLHRMGLKEAIVDINKIRKPDFAVIEGIVGGEGDGPLNNTPVKSNIVFAGKDLVALDTVALTFMGFKVDDSPHVLLASQEKLGISDLSKIKVVGADLNAIKMKFESALK